MKIEFTEIKKIAPLAWCAIMTKGSEIMESLVGNMVECRKEGFVAGIWDADFEEFAFEKATYSNCTGCKVLTVNSGGGNF